MIEIIGKILLGLGLMFTGVQSLSTGLKQLNSWRFRKIATRFVSSRSRALLFGVGSGVIIQSTSAALMILASLITTGLLNRLISLVPPEMEQKAPGKSEMAG